MQMRWDDPAVLVGRTGDDPMLVDEGPLADMIDHVLALPVPLQHHCAIVTGGNSHVLDIMAIRHLRCRSDFSG